MAHTLKMSYELNAKRKDRERKSEKKITVQIHCVSSLCSVHTQRHKYSGTWLTSGNKRPERESEHTGPLFIIGPTTHIAPN